MSSFRFYLFPAAIAAALVLAATAAPQAVPAGWKVVKDRKAVCQVAVPADWIADKIMITDLTAPDKKSKATMGAKPAGVTYAEIVKMAKDMFKPGKSFDDSANRTWFVETATTGKKTAWYAVVNTSPVCEVQVEFQDAAFEADAKKIVESLGKAK